MDDWYLSHDVGEYIPPDDPEWQEILECPISGGEQEKEKEIMNEEIVKGQIIGKWQNEFKDTAMVFAQAQWQMAANADSDHSFWHHCAIADILEILVRRIDFLEKIGNRLIDDLRLDGFGYSSDKALPASYDLFSKIVKEALYAEMPDSGKGEE